MFREEAVGPDRAGIDGQILIGHHRSSSWLALLALLVLVLMAGILVAGSYTRRATGAGHITPHGGVSRLFVAQPGLVIEARVAEGSRVKAGDTLFVISSERQTGEQAQVQLSIVDSIRVREKLIDEQLRNANEAARRDIAAQVQQREGIQREMSKLRTQLKSLQLRQRQAEQEAAQYQSLFAQGLVTRDQRSAREAIADDLATRVSSLEREEFALKRDAEAITQNLETAAARQLVASQALAREAAGIREQLVDAESRRRTIVSAPRDGTITLVQASVGSHVDAGRPVAMLLDADAALKVTVHADGKTVAFLRQGTPATVRVLALPHQRHGTIPARVDSVSKLPAQNQDRLDPIGNLDQAGEPLYAVTLDLERQATSLATAESVLRAGMRVEVDFLLDRRRLWEWMFEPLWLMRQRLHP